MASTSTLMGIFQDVDRAVVALDRLRALGIAEGKMEVHSSLPYSAEILGRPAPKTRLPLIIPLFALAGFLAGAFLAFVTPYLYVIHVGGQAVTPGPPSVIVLYECTMIGLVLGTFGGLLWQGGFLFRDPQRHEPAITDGHIGVLVHCRPEQEAAVRAALESEGAEKITAPECAAL
jgi:hypothetical protein